MYNNYPNQERGYPQQEFSQGYPNQRYPAQEYPRLGQATSTSAGGYPLAGGRYPPASGYSLGGHPPTTGYPTGTYPNQNYPPTEGMAANASYSSPGEDPMSAFDFTEKSIRLNFIKKVYSILTVQLLIVVGFVSIFVFEKNVHKYFKANPEYGYVAVVLVFVLAIMMACCSNVRRTAPMNYICLFLFTIAFSFVTGLAAARYDAREVMLAMGMTAAITLGLTLFAFQTKIDFTVCGGALLALLIVLIISGIFCAIFPSRAMYTVIAGFGAFLMAVYIVYDTQLMLGGSHKYSISPEDYVFASLNLYLDIVNLFLYILQLIGGRN